MRAGVGIARALLRAAEKEARRRGSGKVGLAVGLENAAARLLYERHGSNESGHGSFTVHDEHSAAREESSALREDASLCDSALVGLARPLMRDVRDQRRGRVDQRDHRLAALRRAQFLVVGGRHRPVRARRLVVPVCGSRRRSLPRAGSGRRTAPPTGRPRRRSASCTRRRGRRRSRAGSRAGSDLVLLAYDRELGAEVARRRRGDDACS